MSRNYPMSSKTVRGFMRPSVTTGIARLVDPMSLLNNYQTHSVERQAAALRRDWQSVGVYLKKATKEYGRRQGKRS